MSRFSYSFFRQIEFIFPILSLAICLILLVLYPTESIFIQFLLILISLIFVVLIGLKPIPFLVKKIQEQETQMEVLGQEKTELSAEYENEKQHLLSKIDFQQNLVGLASAEKNLLIEQTSLVQNPDLQDFSQKIKHWVSQRSEYQKQINLLRFEKQILTGTVLQNHEAQGFFLFETPLQATKTPILQGKWEFQNDIFRQKMDLQKTDFFQNLLSAMPTPCPPVFAQEFSRSKEHFAQGEFRFILDNQLLIGFWYEERTISEAKLMIQSAKQRIQYLSKSLQFLGSLLTEKPLDSTQISLWEDHLLAQSAGILYFSKIGFWEYDLASQKLLLQKRYDRLHKTFLKERNEENVFFQPENLQEQAWGQALKTTLQVVFKEKFKTHIWLKATGKEKGKIKFLIAEYPENQALGQEETYFLGKYVDLCVLYFANLQAEKRTEEQAKVIKLYQEFVKQTEIGVCRFAVSSAFPKALEPTEAVAMLEQALALETNPIFIKTLPLQSEKAVLAKRLQDLFPAFSYLEKHTVFDNLLRNGKAVVESLTLGSPNGKPTLYRHEYSLIIENQEVTGFWLSQIPLKELDALTEKAFRQERNYQKILAIQTQGLVVLNPNGKIEFTNSLFEQDYGYDTQDLRNKNFFDFVHPEDEHTVFQAFNKLNTTPNQNQKQVFRLLHQNSEWRMTEVVWNSQENFILLNISDISEKLRQEKANFLREKRLELLFGQSPEAMGVLNLDGKYIFGNEALRKLLGKNYEGVAWTTAVHEDEKEKAQNFWQEKNKSLIIKCLDKEKGAWREMLLSLDDKRQEESIKGYVLHFEDITDFQHKVWEVEQKTAGKTRLFAEASEGLASLDPDGKVKVANKAFYAVFEVENPEDQEINVLDCLVEPAEKAVFEEMLRRYEQRKEQAFWLKTTKGNTIWVEVFWLNLFRTEAVGSMVLGIREATEKKRIFDQSAIWDTMLSHSENVIGIADEKGNWLYANPQKIKVLGAENLEKESFWQDLLANRNCIFRREHTDWKVGLQKVDLADPDRVFWVLDYTDVTESLRLAAELRETLALLEAEKKEKMLLLEQKEQEKSDLLALENATKEKIQVQFSQEKQQTEQKHSVEIRNLEARILQLKAKLSDSEKSAVLGRSMGNLAQTILQPTQEMRNLLAPIEYNINDLQEVLDKYAEWNTEIDMAAKWAEIQFWKAGMGYEKIRPALAKLLATQSEKLGWVYDISSTLYEFTHLESDFSEEISLNKVLDTILKLLKNKIEPKIEVIKKYTPHDSVAGFADRLGQLFISLILNSIEAIESKGFVLITTHETADRVMVSIKDTGSGISQETKVRIFEPFFTTKNSQKHLGMGLNIAKEVIEQHYGYLTVESDGQQGTEYQIAIPKKHPLLSGVAVGKGQNLANN